jgi:hypothetical protein
MKIKGTYFKLKASFFLMALIPVFPSCFHQENKPAEDVKPRVIVTSDGEIDDECSMVRFLLYANEWEVEGIITSSSQYHSHGHNWAGDDWLEPYLDAYAEVYPNLVRHDSGYPTPDHLKSVAKLGNVETEGEMDSITPGSQHIVKVLLDTSDDQPVWIQAWGGTNTIARALKTIEEDHPDQMEYVAHKIRFFFIWEQDSTYQAYIRPHWGKYHIQTIISDQFLAIAYQWNIILPEDKRAYFEGDWMKSNILEDHGALCSLYKAHVPGSHGLSGDTAFNDGDFRSEGDSPSFLHLINTGLRNMESPAYGGWGGRYVNVRSNTWLDPVPVPDYTYPEGRWYTGTAWGRKYMREVYPEYQDQMREYFKPLARWTDAIQNDFAARADWCVAENFEDANHKPVIRTGGELDRTVKSGEEVRISAEGTTDPDGDGFSFKWWQYREAGTFDGMVKIDDSLGRKITFIAPEVDEPVSIHIVLEVEDRGSPALVAYRRMIIAVIP